MGRSWYLLACVMALLWACGGGQPNNGTHRDVDGGVQDGGSGDPSDGSATDQRTQADNGRELDAAPTPATVCEAYCWVFMANCDDGEIYANDAFCLEDCELYFVDSDVCFTAPSTCPMAGDSVECRLYHAAHAGEQDDPACATARLGSTDGPCAPGS